MLKTSIYLMLIIVCEVVMNYGVAMADEAQIPNNFQPETPAFAEEVNENFSAVKDAVNDNFSRINEKQHRISGTCPEGQSIRVVNENGTVACEADDDSGGDITAVNPGSFMSGGGQSGAVTLNVSGMPGVDYAESTPPKYVIMKESSELISATITVPTNGFVYAIFEAEAAINHTLDIPSSISCWISTANNPYDTGGARTYNWYLPETIPTGYYMSPMSISKMIPVIKGSTTIYAMGNSNASDDSENTSFARCHLYLLFFPTRY